MAYTTQAVGEPGLGSTITPGHGIEGNPEAKGFIGAEAQVMPHGAMEHTGHMGSDLDISMGASGSFAVNELTPSEVQAQPGGPLETKQGK